MLALLAALVGILAPAPVSDTPIATDGHVVAWWGNTRGHGVALTVWRPGSRRAPRRIAGVKPGPVGFWDLDVGPGPDGHPWAVYTHCLPGGCNPWAIDLRTGLRRDLGLGHGRAAAIWHRVVVFARDGRLHRGRIGEPTSVRRVATPRGQDVEAVDLRGDQVAYTTWESGEDARYQGLFRGRLDGPAPRRAVAGGGAGEECTRLLRSPSLSASGLTYLVAGAGEASVCGRVSRPVLVTPSGRRAAPTGTLSAAVARGRTVVLAPPPAKARRRDRDRCLRYSEGHATGCEIRTD